MAMASVAMTIERVVAFNGLDVLVARDEGLFAAEGLDLRIAALAPGEMRSTADGTIEKPVTNQGVLQSRGDAAMFQG
jgi:ABC-type nitrate/sulfonate/bicarbonate transport system substrate-binding protein